LNRRRSEERRGWERPIYSAISREKSIENLSVTLSMVEAEWASLIGEPLARRSRPKAFEEGILVVAVDSRAAQQDMNFKKKFILNEIRGRISLDIKDIRTELGGFSGVAPARRPSRAGRGRPRTAQPDEAETASRAVEILASYPALDPALALTLARCRVMGTEINK
jgi:hypothetical protein